MLRDRKHFFRSVAACDETCIECRLYERVLPMAFLCGVLGFLLYFVLFGAPLDFPSGSYIRVKQGATLHEVAQLLKDRRLVRSTAMLNALVRIYGSDKRVYAGEYFFPSPQSVLTIAARLAYGDFEVTPVRMVFWEGTSVKEMAAQLDAKVPDFDANDFLSRTQGQEGYLFPDTYFVLPGQEPVTLVQAMKNNFNRKVATASSTIAKSGKSLKDVIIMASLLQKEASKVDDQRMIAGILWHRIALGMPLQVDAVFPYIIGKNSFQLTKDDLKIDSPYNTYKYKGLPPGPITNPGLSAILAAATPIKNNYLYYLSDKQGNFHYAATYAEHMANRQKYLN